MKIGTVFPQTEFGSDPLAVKDYAQTAEALGFSHVLAYDHVLGANPERPGGWRGPYTYQTTFLEPFVLFSYMAAITQRLGYVTGILILPQRQTALVAKQAATLDVLSEGRFRLGVGVGWNPVEYEALGQDFHQRGKRIEEQVQTLRKLWTQPLVQFEGNFDTIPDAGINPLPIQKPIPIWFGGHADIVLRRMARLGDGWLTSYRSASDAQKSLDVLEGYLAENGRTREDFGLGARVLYGSGNPDEWLQTRSGWQEAGATHLDVNTMGCGFQTPDEHIQALHKMAEVLIER